MFSGVLPLSGEAIEELLGDVMAWASARADVLCVGLVGSHAAGKAHEQSDVDLIVVVEDRAEYLSNDRWLRAFGEVESIEDEDYGLVLSRRVRYTSGLEVEWGLADRRWLCTEPLDEPTARVVADGMRTIYDPRGLLAKLARAVATTCNGGAAGGSVSG
jgi:predicted nucleotidyltransferase